MHSDSQPNLKIRATYTENRLQFCCTGVAELFCRSDSDTEEWRNKDAGGIIFCCIINTEMEHKKKLTAGKRKHTRQLRTLLSFPACRQTDNDGFLRRPTRIPFVWHLNVTRTACVCQEPCAIGGATVAHSSSTAPRHVAATAH